MAEMALGYGSEYQLLRYLGHHRTYLDNQIKKETKSNSPIIWLDYPNDSERDSLDGEWEGIKFLKDQIDQIDYKKIEKAWKKFWPSSGRAQSWDGIFWQDDTLYLVEAKAHVKEMESECKASDESKRTIQDAFMETTNKNEKQAEKWLSSKHYQLANRLAFIHFCNTVCKTIGIKAKLCYIMFINGYLPNVSKNVDKEETFKKAWEAECNALELTPNQLNDIVPVYIDCKKDGIKYK